MKLGYTGLIFFWGLFGRVALFPSISLATENTPTLKASAPPSTEGKTTDMTFIKEKPKPFVYRPVDVPFWDKIERYLRENNPVFILQEAHSQEKAFGSSSSEGQEAHLAQALALEKLTFPHAAFLILTELSKERIGTTLGEAALFHLERLAQTQPVDERALEDLLVQNEFLQVHPDLQSFLGYYKGLYNLRYGYRKWADPQLSKIKADSSWRPMMDYWTAVGEVTRGRTDKAFEAFKRLADEKTLPPKYQNLARLQVARIFFEKGLYQDAEKNYRHVGELGLREFGRILLERAWTAYYLKDYSRSLGLLAALKNPLFNSSISPERYVLEMVVLRDLCFFDLVEKIGREFQKRFKKSLATIQKRKTLHEDRELFYMATLHRDIQDRANFVSTLRSEREKFQRAGLQKFFFYDRVVDDYKRRDKIITAEMEPRLESFSRRAAETLLDTEEQIQFLQYTAKLDALRLIKPEEDRKYRSERISHVKFDRVFWPIEKEFWFEELNDYRTLITSRCGERATPEDLKLERKFR